MNDKTLRCPYCGQFETDPDRYHETDPHPVTKEITVAFWCINCGNEVEYHFSPKHPRYKEFVEE